MIGDDKTEAIELIGEFDMTAKPYKMRSLDNQGNFMTMNAHFNEDGSFHIVGDNMRSRLVATHEDSMSARWERSEDNHTWQHWMDVKLSKLTTAHIIW
jgi:hypothetical protein